MAVQHTDADSLAAIRADLRAELAQYEEDLALARRVVRLRSAVNGVAVVAAIGGGVAGFAARSRTSALYYVASMIVHSAAYNPTVRAGLRELEALGFAVRVERARAPLDGGGGDDDDDDEVPATLVRAVTAQRAARLKIAESHAYCLIARALARWF